VRLPTDLVGSSSTGYTARKLPSLQSWKLPCWLAERSDQEGDRRGNQDGRQDDPTEDDRRRGDVTEQTHDTPSPSDVESVRVPVAQRSQELGSDARSTSRRYWAVDRAVSIASARVPTEPPAAWCARITASRMPSMRGKVGRASWREGERGAAGAA